MSQAMSFNLRIRAWPEMILAENGFIFEVGM
jgi:hypothetical protein